MMMMCCSISCTAYRQSLFILHHIVDRPKRERREEARECEKKGKEDDDDGDCNFLVPFFLLFILYYYSLIRSRSHSHQAAVSEYLLISLVIRL